MTFGFSRDDAGKFLTDYYKSKIYESDPFAKLDQNGVGQLIEMAARKGRATRPDIKLGICGEHGGDPSSVEFCHRAGLDYVSCSPFRVPNREAGCGTGCNQGQIRFNFVDKRAAAGCGGPFCTIGNSIPYRTKKDVPLKMRTFFICLSRGRSAHLTAGRKREIMDGN